MTVTTMDDRAETRISGLARAFRDRPIIPLLGLLAILVIAFILVNPRSSIPDWLGSTLRSADRAT